jgi:hypothetical protein
VPETALTRSELLVLGVVAAQLPPAEVPEVRMVRRWLDSWDGVGQLVGFMNQLGYHPRFTQTVFGWWAEFCRVQVNALPSWLGRGFDGAPWRAAQRAALETLKRDETAPSEPRRTP